jgi:hypothetical protein
MNAKYSTGVARKWQWLSGGDKGLNREIIEASAFRSMTWF